MYESKFGRSEPPPSVKPRRVRGGVRMVAREWPLRSGWIGQAWLDSIGALASEDALREGFEYARSGQTRTLEFESGRIVAAVQGRSLRAYRVVIEAPVFTDEQWESIVHAMSDQALFGAKMLSGEMPEAIPELFAAFGLRLFPAPEELRCACSASEEIPWCKHVCCAALLAAEALEKRPFEIFALRGMEPGALLERLREQRAEVNASASGGAMAPAGSPVTAERSPSRPLESCVDEFWEAGAALDTLETPLRRPEVEHALLRRLGPSPFAEARFPLVGLLATCYDTISKSALEQAGPTDEVPQGNDTGPRERDPIEPPQTKPPERDAGGAWPMGTAKRKVR